ncbi:MAG: hypothetical protein HFE64_02050 [Lachnospiraceae bacterium]|jgi:hypothetical protein|nr:hypothetical protein [Lachnospiraceae bacterium]
MKKKFFAGILVAAMLLVSIGALAKTNSDTVPFDGGGYGVITIGISEQGYSAWAETVSYSANNEVLSTRVKGYGTSVKDATGHSDAAVTGNFTSAESWHAFFGRSSCNMYIYR